MDPNLKKQKRIYALFRHLAEVSDPLARRELQSELRHLLIAQARLQTPNPRQLRIIEMVAEGLKNREIADNFGVTPLWVRNYLRTIYTRIGVDNRLKLALWYEEQVHEGNLPHTLHRKSPGI